MLETTTSSAIATALLLTLAASSALAEPAAGQSPLDGLEPYLESQRVAAGVPGLAVAVVHRDSVILLRGFGVRRIGRPESVDPHTVFEIASSTKAFTAAGLGLLVAERRLRWDDPVIDHVPEFRVADPHLTAAITVRDLLTHRTGLPDPFALWYRRPIARAEVLRRLRHLEAVGSFRAGYLYNNTMYMVAGTVAERISGTKWESFIARRLLRPLGMDDASVSIASLDGHPNAAAPHAKVDATVSVVELFDGSAAAPAGAINASAADLARWLRFLLGRGRIGDVELLPGAIFDELVRPQVVLQSKPLAGLIQPAFAGYGLGWLVHELDGYTVVQHGGNIDGMTAMIGFVPELSLGVAVLANLNASGLPAAVLYEVVGRFAAPDVVPDWPGRLLARLDTLQRAAGAPSEPRITGTRPSHPRPRYVGRYTSALLGEAAVMADSASGELMLEFGAFRGPLQHWHFDTFRAVWRDRLLGTALIRFELDERGDVARLHWPGLGDFDRERRLGQ